MLDKEIKVTRLYNQLFSDIEGVICEYNDNLIPIPTSKDFRENWYDISYNITNRMEEIDNILLKMSSIYSSLIDMKQQCSGPKISPIQKKIESYFNKLSQFREHFINYKKTLEYKAKTINHKVYSIG